MVCYRPNASHQEVRIGLIAYSAKANDIGPAMIAAVRLAVGAANDAGGARLADGPRPVNLIIKQADPTPEAALAAAYELINRESVVAVIGPHWTRDALPVAVLAESSRIPMITTGSTDPQTTQGKRYVFRIHFTDAQQGRVLAYLARHDLQASRAALLYEASDPYARTLCAIFSEAFTALDGQVVAVESYTPDNDEDFTSQLRRIKAAAADVLFLPNQFEPVVRQASQARAVGVRAPILGTDNWNVSASDTRVLPAVLDGALVTRQGPFDPVKYEAFAAAYARATGRRPDADASSAYDAAGLLLEAMRVGGAGTPEAIRDALDGMGVYAGVTGAIDYQSSGSPARALEVLQIRQGRAIRVRDAS